MSKRLSSSNEGPLPKRSHRQPAGFRLARPPPDASQASQPTSSSDTSLFVTVSQPDERRNVLQAQNRVLFSTPGPSVVPTPDSSTPSSNPPSESHTTASVEQYSEPQDEPAPQEQQQTGKPKRKRNTTNAVGYHLLILSLNSGLTVRQHRLTEWLKFRAAFLDEALRHDGLGDFFGQQKCSSCGNRAGIIKCKDCTSGGLLKCPECVVALHQTLPLHRVEVSHVLVT